MMAKERFDWKYAFFIFSIQVLATFVTGYFLIENQDYLLFQPKIAESLNQSITIEVAERCEKGDDLDKVACVHNFIKNNFNYVVSETKSLEETIAEGGDCKSWSVAYRSILTRMNIKNKPITTENHVFVVAYGDKWYCILDQVGSNCVRLG